MTKKEKPKPRDINSVIGEVKGENGVGEPFSFDLTCKRVKHIRRCMRIYDRIHPTEGPRKEFHDNLFGFFLQFGRLNPRQIIKLRKEQLKKKGDYVCSSRMCKYDKDLTLDHIENFSENWNNKLENFQWLCVRHHLIKNLDDRIKNKESEIKLLKKMKREEQKKLKDKDYSGGVM